MQIGLMLFISALNLGSITASPVSGGPEAPALAIASPNITAPLEKPSSVQTEDGQKAADAAPKKDGPTPTLDIWGEFMPGAGFLVARTSFGELDISGYALVRYIN